MRLTILLSLLLFASSPPKGGAMEVVADGRYKGTAEEYRVGKTVYLAPGRGPSYQPAGSCLGAAGEPGRASSWSGPTPRSDGKRIPWGRR